jgi:hypothetical protein
MPDYRVEYYENEEAYLSGDKPKGTMLLDGYEVCATRCAVQTLLLCQALSSSLNSTRVDCG